MLDVTFISQFRERLTNMSFSLREYAAYFKALALADRYNYMLQLMDERAGQHPEVTRVPQLKTLLLQYFIQNYATHINVREERIFNPGALGTLMTLQQWQEAGYRTRSKRTTKNYYQRLQYWKSIYDNQPMRVHIDVSNKAMGTATLKKQKYPLPRTGDDIFGGRQQSLFYEIRVKDRSGNIITYEDVIEKRNLGFGAATNKLVPFWLPLNYGSDAGLQPGYPPTPGLHFIEDAERTIPRALSDMSSHFPRFMLYLLDNETTARDFTIAERWSSENIRLSDGALNPYAVAIELAYGLPF